jgi:hypothetical protein
MVDSCLAFQKSGRLLHELPVELFSAVPIVQCRARMRLPCVVHHSDVLSLLTQIPETFLPRADKPIE